MFDNLESLGEHFCDMILRYMEYYGQNFGYILYRTKIKAGQGTGRRYFVYSIIIMTNE